MSKKFLMAAALAAGALIWAPLARADLLVTYSIDGGPTTTLCSAANPSPSCAGSASANGITITLDSATSNAPGTPSLADLLSAVASISNGGTSTGTVVLTIGDINFLLPTTPPNLDLHSQVGGTVVTGTTANALSFVSTVDQGNGQNTSPGTYNAPALNPSITASGSSYNASNNTLITSLGSPYSMTEVLDVTLGAGAIINYSSSTDVSPIPEPASLTLLGTALVGLGAFRRRRKQVV